MSGERNDKDLPLHDEARARDEWRKGETIVEGGGEWTGNDGRPGKGSPGTIPPPD